MKFPIGAVCFDSFSSFSGSTGSADYLQVDTSDPRICKRNTMVEMTGTDGGIAEFMTACEETIVSVPE